MPRLSKPSEEQRRPPYAVDELVLDVVAKNTCALSAHEIARQLTESGQPVAATQAYRSLTRLVEDARVGRIEGLNAYCRVAKRAGPVIYCRHCRSVVVSDRRDLMSWASGSANGTGFRVRQVVSEVSGVCASCSAK